MSAPARPINSSEAALISALVDGDIRELLKHWSAEETEKRVREAMRQLRSVAKNSGQK